MFGFVILTRLIDFHPSDSLMQVVILEDFDRYDSFMQESMFECILRQWWLFLED